jgi:hypothetical protein
VSSRGKYLSLKEEHPSFLVANKRQKPQDTQATMGVGRHLCPGEDEIPVWLWVSYFTSKIFSFLLYQMV